ncbi:MAG: NUDIX hydrolase [Gammaproteobacteria bacterium]|nr:NUDIX hydrolase [Gammaproteobacteria bacterium]
MELLKSNWITLFEDQYRLPNGADCTYYHVSQNDAVMAIAIEQSESGLHTYIVNQYRHPIGQSIWQFPLGGINPETQDAVHAAKVELAEETGVTVGDTQYRGSFFSNPGFSNQRIHVCISSDIVSKTRPCLEESEYGLISRRVELSDIASMVSSGEMGDSWGIIGLHYLNQYISDNPELETTLPS